MSETTEWSIILLQCFVYLNQKKTTTTKYLYDILNQNNETSQDRWNKKINEIPK